MKYRPIIFNTHEVINTLDGRQTQFRRVVKPQYENQLKQLPGFGDKWQHPIGQMVEVVNVKCPYGQVGDRLWVKETFNDDWCDHVIYRADGGSAIAAGYSAKEKWKPSIHLPREASRITLENTGVRIERLQDISEQDGIAMGIEIDPNVSNPGTPYEAYNWIYAQAWRDYLNGGYDVMPVESYKSLWDSINAKKHPWANNDWVWVVDFKRVED